MKPKDKDRKDKKEYYEEDEDCSWCIFDDISCILDTKELDLSNLRGTTVWE